MPDGAAVLHLGAQDKRQRQRPHRVVDLEELAKHKYIIGALATFGVVVLTASQLLLGHPQALTISLVVASAVLAVLAVVGLLLLAATPSLQAQTKAEVPVDEFMLDNGMKFLLVQRPELTVGSIAVDTDPALADLSLDAHLTAGPAVRGRQHLFDRVDPRAGRRPAGRSRRQARPCDCR